METAMTRAMTLEFTSSMMIEGWVEGGTGDSSNVSTGTAFLGEDLPKSLPSPVQDDYGWQHDDNNEKSCRICLLGTTGDDVLQLGCSCKDALGRAHQKCAKKWFELRRTRQCEICLDTAVNVQFRYEFNVNYMWQSIISGVTWLAVLCERRHRDEGYHLVLF